MRRVEADWPYVRHSLAVRSRSFPVAYLVESNARVLIREAIRYMTWEICHNVVFSGLRGIVAVNPSSTTGNASGFY